MNKKESEKQKPKTNEELVQPEITIDSCFIIQPISTNICTPVSVSETLELMIRSSNYLLKRILYIKQQITNNSVHVSIYVKFTPSAAWLLLRRNTLIMNLFCRGAESDAKAG